MLREDGWSASDEPNSPWELDDMGRWIVGVVPKSRTK